MTNNNDWAISVGITKYPGVNGLEPLDGAEEDARDFHRWVTDANGGAVPVSQAKLLVTSQFEPPEPPHQGRAPSRNLVDGWLRELLHENDAGRAGRRLYMFFSCHGFAPDTNDVACLMADATLLSFSHIPGNGWADDFYRLGKFDEVVLFADCCRTSITQAGLMGTGISHIANKAGISQRKRFYGLAAAVTQAAMQVPDVNGNPRGAFTMALLDGLRGKAADPETGVVGSASLKKFLNNFARDYLSDDVAEHSSKIDPEIRGDTDQTNQIVFCTHESSRAKLKINLNLPDGIEDGSQVNILKSVSNGPPKLEASGQFEGGSCELNLNSGLYTAFVGFTPFTLIVAPTGKWELEHG